MELSVSDFCRVEEGNAAQSVRECQKVPFEVSGGGALPVRVGSSSVLIVVSRGSRRVLMLVVVRAR